MSGVGSQLFTDLQKLGSTHLNAGGRWAGKSLQEILGAIFMSDAAAISTTGRMAAGLQPAITGGTMNVVVGAGVAAFAHAGALTAVIDGSETVPDEVWAEVAGATLTPAANASGSTRFDVVAVQWSLATDRSLSMPQKTGPPVPQDTRWQPTGTLVLVAGTPGAGVPALSSVQQGLYSIELPDGTNAANFDANAIIKELCPFVSPQRLGPGQGAAWGQWLQPDDATETLVLARRPTAPRDRVDSLGLAVRFSDAASPNEALDWWPRFTRPFIAMPSGEASADLHPMVIPGGREWPIFLAWSGGSVNGDLAGGPGLAPTDDGLLVKFARTAVNAQGWEAHAALPVAGRGLQLIDATFRWTVGTAFDATVISQQLFLKKVDQDGTPTTLGTTSPVLTTAGTKTYNFTPTGSPVLAAGERLVLTCFIQLDADGTAVGELVLGGVNLTFREGRQ